MLQRIYLGNELRFKTLFRFFVAIDEVTSAKLLSEELEILLAAFQFEYYCVLHQPKPIENPAELIVAANLPPEWVVRYVEKKYIVVDPAIRYLLRCNSSFSWSTAWSAYRDHPNYNRIRSMVVDGASYGLVSGYVFPVFGRNGLLGATTVGGRASVELTPAEMALLESAFRNAYFRYLDFIGCPLPEHVGFGKEIALTHREMQALTNLAEGKTSGEIAAALKVSPTTVDWHVSGLQAKLNAKNRNHVVALALRRGLIS